MQQFSSVKRTLGFALVSLTVILLWYPLHASAVPIQVFTNRTAWEASLVGKSIQTESFNEFTGFTYQTGAGLAFQFPAGATNIGKLRFDVDRPSGNLIVERTFFDPVDGTTFWRVEASTQNGTTPPVTPALIFSQDTFGFGADWNFFFAPRATMTLADNTLRFRDYLGAGISFFGITSPTAFRRVEFDVESPFNTLFHADNISFAQVQTVPEPSSMTVLFVLFAYTLRMRIKTPLAC